jgi:surfactin synthase thioesterase subunit
MQKINLYCFPFAGGSKYSYSEFIKKAPAHFNVISLDLPGRGTRFKERLLTNIKLMADDLFNQIRADLHRPYIFYGHSMGTLLSYLVSKKIEAENLNKPLFLFLTGCGSPGMSFPREKNRYLLPKKEFIEKLKSYGGSPDQILEDENLLSYFEPILRADFQAVDTYQHDLDNLLNIPITIITGTEESVTQEEAEAWKDETTREVEVYQFPGKHFFIYNYIERILEMIHERAIRYSYIST